MKRVFAFLSLLTILFFSSCERCMECSYTQLDGELFITEKCGNKDDVEAFENEMEEEAYEHRERPECSVYK